MSTQVVSSKQTQSRVTMSTIRPDISGFSFPLLAKTLVILTALMQDDITHPSFVISEELDSASTTFRKNFVGDSG